MLPYATYLRVYESLSAFPEPDRSVWARYADAADHPRRVAALEAEHDAAIHRLVARPPVVAPARESADAYVRRTTDMTFVFCPWQTRLRSWVAFSAFLATLPRTVADAFAPRIVADQAEADLERWKRRGDTLRSYILSSTGQVPFAWFILFGATERCLALGASPEPESAPSVPGVPGAADRRRSGPCAPSCTKDCAADGAPYRRCRPRIEHTSRIRARCDHTCR